MDIVERLRVLNFMGPWQEAADEIERLRLANSDLQMHYDYAITECDKLQAEVIRLREVLQQIAEIARSELKEKE